MSNEVKKEIDSVFKDIFDNVNTWLHFAEAKNVALIAMNIALLSAIFSASNIYTCFFLYFTISSLFIVSTLFCLFSFLPKLTRIQNNKTSCENNLLFYAYIASLTPTEYVKRIYNYYFENASAGEEISPLHLDYAKEIVSNSRITVRKIKIFNCALATDFIALLLLILLIICA